MKKVFTFLAAAFCAFTAETSAQSEAPGAQQQASEQHTTGIETGTSKAVLRSAASESYWLNYALARRIGGTTINFFGYLFPDSNVVVCPSTCYDPFNHQLGNVLDPFAPLFRTYYGINWNQFNSYTVDSMEIFYYYERKLANSVIDTLIVYLYSDEDVSNLPENFFRNQSAFYGVDTVFFKQMLYNFTANAPMASNLQTFKIPLGISDTSRATAGRKKFSTNSFFVPAGNHVVASSVSFKPGYSYVPGDTITLRKNNFMFLSYEENGLNTYPSYTPGDYNASSIIRTQERYNYPGNVWNGYYLPTYAFVQAYATEHHRIAYKVTSTTVGINENNNALNTLKLSQNVPNPAAGSTIINYETAIAGTAALELSDVTGRKLQEINMGHQAAGKHSVTLDVKDISGGMYFYTLRINENSLTRSMIIAE